MEQDDEIIKHDEKDENGSDLLDSVAFSLIDDISHSKKVSNYWYLWIKVFYLFFYDRLLKQMLIICVRNIKNYMNLWWIYKDVTKSSQKNIAH